MNTSDPRARDAAQSLDSALDDLRAIGAPPWLLELLAHVVGIVRRLLDGKRLDP